jgi:3-isopropylmalate dehydrogenase
VASAAMLLRHSLGEEAAADALDAAVDDAVASGPRTTDLGGRATTDEVTSFLLERIGLTTAGAPA